MTTEELEVMVEKLKREQKLLVKDFAINVRGIAERGYDASFAAECFAKMVEMHNLISEYERYIAASKGARYVNKFGKLVSTEDDLTFWNEIYDRVSTKRER